MKRNGVDGVGQLVAIVKTNRHSILISSSFKYVYVCVCVCVCVVSCWGEGWVCGTFVPQPEIEPGPSAVKAQSPNHWTTRELPAVVIFYKKAADTELVNTEPFLLGEIQD